MRTGWLEMSPRRKKWALTGALEGGGWGVGKYLRRYWEARTTATKSSRLGASCCQVGVCILAASLWHGDTSSLGAPSPRGEVIRNRKMRKMEPGGGESVSLVLHSRDSLKIVCMWIYVYAIVP